MDVLRLFWNYLEGEGNVNQPVDEAGIFPEASTSEAAVVYHPPAMETRPPSPIIASPEEQPEGEPDDEPWPTLSPASLTESYMRRDYPHFGGGQCALFFGLYPPNCETVKYEEVATTSEDHSEDEEEADRVTLQPPMVRTLYSEVVKRNLVAGGPWKKKTTESKEDGGCESHLQLRAQSPVDNADLANELTCGICLSIVRKPVFTCVPCAHKFCRNCILRWMRDKRPPPSCPSCRDEIREIIPDVVFANVVDFYFRAHPEIDRPEDCPPLEEDGLAVTGTSPLRLGLISPDTDPQNPIIRLAMEARHRLNTVICQENIIPLYWNLRDLIGHIRGTIERAESALLARGYLEPDVYQLDTDYYDDEDDEYDADGEDEDEEDEEDEEVYEDAVEEWEDAVDESGDEDLGGQREEDVLVHARRPLASHAVSSFSEGHAAPTESTMLTGEPRRR